MKLAVTYENGEVFQHFGHTAFFKIYTIEDNSIKNSVITATDGAGHGALAGFLKTHQVDTLICGGIGGGAKAALAEAGITLYAGVSGNADEQVQNFLSGVLVHHPDTLCNHHHEAGHSCGSHHHNESHCGHHHCSSSEA